VFLVNQTGQKTIGALVAVVVVLLAPPAIAAEKTSIRMKIVNASKHAVQAVYVSRTDASGWGENLLKQPQLKAGQRVVITAPGGCGRYDVRLVAPKGVELVDEDVDFCDDDDVVTLQGDKLTRKKATDTASDAN
jgi:hypothetical protein